jgi:acetylornithine deacetylase/succinyl-diaminopimelate desuccinylase-like protein
MGGSLKTAASMINATELPEIADIAGSPGVRECLHSFSRERQWINEQHLLLCRIPAPTFLEGKRAEWMVAQFRSIGCDARIDRGGNVVAQLEPAAKGPFVAVTAHLDTVLAPRHSDDVRLDPDGTFRGPGVSDNGAGLAALLALARAFKNCSNRIETAASSLLLVANVGEEGEGNLNGMRYLCRQSSLAGKIRAFVVLDGPATDHITAYALASRRFEVSYTGPGGHSWSDFGVGNPVHALSRAIAAFLDHPAAVLAGGPRASFNFGTVDGGASINSIPSEARSKVDIRSESSAKIDELVAALAECVDRSIQAENERAVGGRVAARIREIGSRPGGRLADQAPILRFIRGVDSYLGIRSHVDCASTDANIPLSMNLPAISIGAGGQGGGAHTPSEWFHPDGREVGLRRILLTLLLLLENRQI